jgi:hypothetical protein
MELRGIELTPCRLGIADATNYTIGSDTNLVQIVAISLRFKNSTAKKKSDLSKSKTTREAKYY